ncbi:hypothetical protein [Candidatus Cardinium hertigii]|uniref:hypothetical protein n=1 Tax=Candidatus Cardinium hertigii TaxID=247481 RepID=UPI001FA98E41|nr:hypothetical protein [Candidatus Cardinium hertigii]
MHYALSQEGNGSLPSDLNGLPPLKPRKTYAYDNPKSETQTAMGIESVASISVATPMKHKSSICSRLPKFFF